MIRFRTVFFYSIYKLISFFFDSKQLRKFISLKLSTRKQSILEITAQIGCTMMCSYCPQTLIVSEAREKNVEKIMDLENFKKMLNNVSQNTLISWAGYTEPLLHSNFIDFVEFANEKGFVQTINTTMHGKNDCQAYMSKTNVFRSVGFHLPDNEGLMKLSVKDSYLAYLDKAIRHQSKILNKANVDIKIIGDKPHFKIQELLNKLCDEKVIDKKQILSNKKISSRNSYIDQKKGNYKFFSYFKNKSKKLLNNKPLYYCSYRRLKSNVLTPNGEVNICCNDYSLGYSLGNLINEKLDVLQKHEKLIEQTDFLNGEMNVCSKCEYYKSI
tara:strand:+ start:1944 stop:2924 length:981 start_codon:yes stop_codon:yes gene_type:complete